MVWIICDGNIDPEWVEALNSVLDDNRLLTMPNGERVQLTQNVNFIFECDTLRFASPATVSRCAVIYTNSSSHDGCDLIAARVAMAVQGHQQSEQICAWLVETFPLVLAWLQAQPAVSAVTLPLAVFASTAITVLRCWPVATGSAAAVCRAIAASLRPYAGAREAFLAAAREWCAGTCVWGLQPAEDPTRALQVLSSQDASYMMTDQGHHGEYEIVLTPALQEYLAVLVPWFKETQPILLVGPQGSGKRCLIQAALAHMRGTLRADLFCNSQMQADDVIHKLMQVHSLPCLLAHIHRVYSAQIQFGMKNDDVSVLAGLPRPTVRVVGCNPGTILKTNVCTVGLDRCHLCHQVVPAVLRIPIGNMIMPLSSDFPRC